MDKFANGKIPFADAPNPPHTAYKTPSHNAHGRMQPAKPSPQYTNGDNISLPDVHTDSEDEDDGDGFNPPEWARTPEVFEALIRQDAIDGGEVFGPVAPLHMEEIFKNKERQKRFRDRTSSANWLGQDRLTEDEIRKDLADREKMRRDGGWTYGL